MMMMTTNMTLRCTWFFLNQNDLLLLKIFFYFLFLFACLNSFKHVCVVKFPCRDIIKSLVTEIETQYRVGFYSFHSFIHSFIQQVFVVYLIYLSYNRLRYLFSLFSYLSFTYLKRFSSYSYICLFDPKIIRVIIIQAILNTRQSKRCQT